MRPRAAPGLSAVAFLVGSGLAALAGADEAQLTPLVCPGGAVTVSAADTAIIGPVCAASAAAQAALAECHLTLSAPVNVSIVAQMAPEHGNCFGLYDCDAERITVLHPTAIAASPEKGNAFKRLETTRLFQSLIAHELTHAAFAQTTGDRRISHAMAEYMGYVMQLTYLQPQERQVVLAAHPVTDPVTVEGLNDFILFSSPSYFAAKAWRHFGYPENGCELFQRIIDGEMVFPAVLP